jgi:pyrimidine deaminase RibD-like protein
MTFTKTAASSATVAETTAIRSTTTMLSCLTMVYLEKCSYSGRQGADACSRE